METTQTPKTLRPQTFSKAMQVYLVCFDSFAASKSEISSATGLSKGQVTGALKTLEEAGLVSSYDVNESAQGAMRRGQYAELAWQCWETYDSIDREEAIELFKTKFTTTQDEREDAVSATAEAPEATTDTTTDAPAPEETTTKSTKKDPDSPKARGKKPAKPTKGEKGAPAATKQPRKVHLTNSQRRALLKLEAGPVQIEGLSALAVQPFEYFVAEGLATKTAKQYKINAAGKTRAADIDRAKYGA